LPDVEGFHNKVATPLRLISFAGYCYTAAMLIAAIQATQDYYADNYFRRFAMIIIIYYAFRFSY